jgi:hypothetical protein
MQMKKSCQENKGIMTGLAVNEEKLSRKQEITTG